MKNWAKSILTYHQNLKPELRLPPGIEWLDSYGGEETQRVMDLFYRKYYSDGESRCLLLGINPGRFGAGVTGVPFTDPIRLEDECGISNRFDKKREISSVFIYHMIDKWGDVRSFYQRYLITSLCPMGFLKDGKNYNYYDDKELAKAVEPLIKSNIETLFDFGAEKHVAYCLGRGKNADFFHVLNAKYHFFDKIVPLPHPRWVMQYRLKEVEKHIDAYVDALRKSSHEP